MPARGLEPQVQPPAGASRGGWLRGHVAGLIALAAGVATLVVVAVHRDGPWAAPDLRLALPGLGVTALAAGAALARRERAYALWALGLGAAAAACVLGWVVVTAVVVAVTAGVVLVLHAVM